MSMLKNLKIKFKKKKERIQVFQKKLEEILKKENFIKHKYGLIGDIPGPGDGPNPPVPPKKNKKISKIVIELTHEISGKGVVFRPKIKSLNSNDEEVKNPALKWNISNNNVVREHERELNLCTCGIGKTTIQVEL